MKPIVQLIALLMLFAFAGCATVAETERERPKDIAFTAVETQIPVREKCIVEEPEAPLWLTERLDLSKATELDRSQAILAELEQARSYIVLFKANAKKCR